MIVGDVRVGNERSSRMRWTRNHPVAGTIVVTVVIAALVGGGWALAAPGGGAIHGCVSKATGALRVAAHCKRNERAITWNVQGPAGATGASGVAGSPGSPGSPGAEGPSNAWLSYKGGPVSLTTSYATVATLGPLPAGSYVVDVTLNAKSGDTLEDYAFCILGNNANSNSDLATVSVPAAIPSGAQEQEGWGTLALEAATTTSSAVTWKLQCAYNPIGNSGPVDAELIQMQAIQVSSLNIAASP
jgi:hypothetical protein